MDLPKEWFIRFFGNLACGHLVIGFKIDSRGFGMAVHLRETITTLATLNAVR